MMDTFKTMPSFAPSRTVAGSLQENLHNLTVNFLSLSFPFLLATATKKLPSYGCRPQGDGHLGSFTSSPAVM